MNTIKNAMMAHAGSGKLISVYNNAKKPSACGVGYLLYCNDTHYVLWEASSDGRYDGVFLQLASRVFRIEAESDYNKKIAALMDFNHVQPDPVVLNENNLALSLLQYAKENQLNYLEVMNMIFAAMLNQLMEAFVYLE